MLRVSVKSKIWIGVGVATVFVLAGLVLPMGELISWLEFRVWPSYAKASHFRRFRMPHSEGTVYLLGTVHEMHFAEGASYPYWQIKSVIRALSPEEVLVEIRPASLDKELWGEGPPEMPYAVAVSKEAGIAFAGIDFWRPDYISGRDFDEREDRMADLIVKGIGSRKSVLILTGFSHVAGISRRLVASGFQPDFGFSSEEKMELFFRNEDAGIPESYFSAVGKVAALVESKQSDYPPKWASKRQSLLQVLRDRFQH